MNLLILLLTIFVIGAWTKPDAVLPPPYYASQQSLKASIDLLTNHVFNLDGKIPDLTNPNRHYIQIVHSIYNLALEESHNCLRVFNYDAVYQYYINSSIPEAVSEPQKVADNTKKVVENVQKKTQNIQQLVKETCQVVENKIECDKIVDTVVKNDEKTYKDEAKVLLLAGTSAQSFLDKNEEYEKVSDKLEASKYVIENPEKLKDPVHTLSDLLRATEPPYQC